MSPRRWATVIIICHTTERDMAENAFDNSLTTLPLDDSIVHSNGVALSLQAFTTTFFSRTLWEDADLDDQTPGSPYPPCT